MAVHSNFNYIASDACDRNLIDLMDEGDNYVSNNCNVPLSGGDLQQLVRPTITTTIFAENFDAEFVRYIELLNSSQQFNYDRDKIVEITDENENLFLKQTRDAANFTNDETRKFKIGNSGDNVEDDTKNKIRFKEHDAIENEAKRRPGGDPQVHPTSSDTGCDELDNCLSSSKIAERG